mmetsp:Transcript_3682/g.7871  ORF Transcript_3682/g.7871 Transcript_3682/m.7871 type:complete len:217 (-) Transcript_3682:661-1311(-)
MSASLTVSASQSSTAACHQGTRCASYTKTCPHTPCRSWQASASSGQRGRRRTLLTRMLQRCRTRHRRRCHRRPYMQVLVGAFSTSTSAWLAAARRTADFETTSLAPRSTAVLGTCASTGWTRAPELAVLTTTRTNATSIRPATYMCATASCTLLLGGHRTGASAPLASRRATRWRSRTDGGRLASRCQACWARFPPSGPSASTSPPSAGRRAARST